MKSLKFWLRVLNVYPGEWEMVKRLYVFQFFQGAGIAFFFTSAFAQFLNKYPITELPWVMIISAVLLWIAGFVFTKLEHKYSFEKFNWSVILFMTLSILMLWVFNNQSEQDWFLYLLLAWFNVLYLLNNLQFWGIASLLFDLRQSKRLFAVISAGDIPAKFVGYTLALIVLPYTGTKNLLLFGTACLISSLPFFTGILRSDQAAFHSHTGHKRKKADKQQLHKSLRIGKVVQEIATNTYIRRIAIISLLTSVCIILINYGFYGEVKKAFHDDVALAGFIAFFYAALRIIAFITKMVFASRLTASMGVNSTLFITPVSMVVLISIIVISGWLTSDQVIIFYLFGVCAMLVDLLRSSFNSPVLLTLMQPLPTHERLRAHNIVKGIMDPFASLLSGLFLLFLFYLHQRVDLMLLCDVLLLLGAFWITGVILVNRQYLNILIKALGTRYFSREEFNLHDETLLKQLTQKMIVGSETEVISILRMLNNKIDSVSSDLIIRLLQHPSKFIKLETLQLIGNQRITSAKSGIEKILQDNTDNEDVKNQAVKTYCCIAADDWNLSEWIENSNAKIKRAAITGLLANPINSIKQRGEQGLDALLYSRNKDNKLTVISILTEVNNEYDYPGHANMIEDPDPEIRRFAIKAIGKSSSLDAIEALLGYFKTEEKQVTASLLRAGTKTIPLIRKLIFSGDMTGTLQIKLITLIGKIGGEQAIHLLLELLKKQPFHIGTILKALYRCRFTADEEMQKLLEAIARNYIQCAVELLHMQQALEKDDYRYAILSNALEIELRDIRETLLCLFGCIYDRGKINQVKSGLSTNKKEIIANAMEIVELTVKKDIGRPFNTLFESTGIEERCLALRTLFTEKQFSRIEHILVRILSEQPLPYYNWTKACSLYISKKYRLPVDTSHFDKFIHSENLLLKETALFASATT